MVHFEYLNLNLDLNLLVGFISSIYSYNHIHIIIFIFLNIKFILPIGNYFVAFDRSIDSQLNKISFVE